MRPALTSLVFQPKLLERPGELPLMLPSQGIPFYSLGFFQTPPRGVVPPTLSLPRCKHLPPPHRRDGIGFPPLSLFRPTFLPLAPCPAVSFSLTHLSSSTRILLSPVSNLENGTKRVTQFPAPKGGRNYFDNTFLLERQPWM